MEETGPDVVVEEVKEEPVVPVPTETQTVSALDPNMKIVSDYKKPNEKVSLGVQKCPNCKQEIAKTEWRQHFKICMMDSKWRDNKQ